MFVLAHLSDPHLAPLPQPSLRELAGKRLGGFVNWRRNSRHVHLRAVLERIERDLTSRAPDHIAVTGDLVNLSLAAEFAPARAWLGQLGSPQDVTLVPGNHDSYVRATAREAQRQWADYMRADDMPSLSQDATFPFLRRRGPVALIGLSTSAPQPIFRATGRLGAEQLARLGELLGSTRSEGLFRVVLIHHPPVSAPERRHERLLDGQAFVDVLARHGAELVLHGHEHVHCVRWLAGSGGRAVPAIGVPSASARAGGHRDSAAYNLYAIEGGPGAWHCEMRSRGLAADREEVAEIRRIELTESL
jgi:3',5'-cyclic AMP phosphodiesterase CpdA